MDTTTTTAVSSRRRRRILAAACAAALLGLGLAACGDDDDDDAATETTAPAGDNGDSGGGDAVEYEVTEVQYEDVTAPAGGTIEIVNTSGTPHTFTSDDDAFDEVEFDADASATVAVPDEAGDYPFHCEIHSSMQATLTVE